MCPLMSRSEESLPSAPSRTPNRRVTLCDAACRGVPALDDHTGPRGQPLHTAALDLSTRAVLTLDETVATLGISRPHLYKLRREAGLPVAMLGRKPAVPVDALRRWLDQQAQAREGGAR